MKTRKRLRALISITRSMNVGLATGGDSFTGASPGFQRTLRFRLGVDQEIGARYDALVFLETGRDRIDVAKLAAEFDEARLELTATLVHQYDVMCAGTEHGVHRQREGFSV